ncbi:membrane stabilizing protein MspA [Staphylococcus aureus]|uniref:membrane stabilizing protein MspA n=1 Tax=Staphylococcus aureus TaxID=1280 RepID=UPI001C4F9FCD|nr:membrane stabilizing protein MspA [Staphylococcus aureus]MBW0703615.1 membrane stabilizing protein MspA [Staphylococcus aureus]MBW0720639.1 membrane stabilizing protein MspA [Staphylococcus aureus]
MQFYLILLAILYLIVSFISIFKMEVVFTRILRIIMGVLLLFVLALTTMSFPKENWWVFIVLLLLVGNVEVTGFKMLKKDLKGVNILNLMSLFIFVIYFILTIVLFSQVQTPV